MLCSTCIVILLRPVVSTLQGAKLAPLHHLLDYLNIEISLKIRASGGELFGLVLCWSTPGARFLGTADDTFAIADSHHVHRGISFRTDSR